MCLFAVVLYSFLYVFLFSIVSLAVFFFFLAVPYWKADSPYPHLLAVLLTRRRQGIHHSVLRLKHQVRSFNEP